MCLAASAAPADIAQALDLDLATADRVGSQRIFPPPTGTTYFELVVERDGISVVFLEFVPTTPLTAAALAGVFGDWREAPAGPHQIAPTLLFDDLWPDAAQRGCSVLARSAPGWPQLDRVEGVVLYLQPQRIG